MTVNFFMINFAQNSGRRWYQTGWGVALAALVVVIILVIIGFCVLVGIYWWKIKQGGGDALLNQIMSAQIKKEDPVLAAKREELETADDPYLGNPDAKDVIVEFVDFKCSNCKEAAPIVRKIAEKYGYKVKIIIRDFPVESLHKEASQLAEIASCANEQGRYWLTHDLFFQNQEQLGENLDKEKIAILAGMAGADSEKIQECLKSGRAKIEVNKDYAIGFKNQIKGTPTFFINGQKVDGAASWEDWEKFLKKL